MAGRPVVDGVHDGGERILNLPVAARVGKQAAQPGEDGGGVVSFGRIGEQAVAEAGHRRGRLDAVAGDVADDETYLAVRQLEDVVPVPADRAEVRRDVPGGEGQFLHGWKARREERAGEHLGEGPLPCPHGEVLGGGSGPRAEVHRQLQVLPFVGRPVLAGCKEHQS